MPWPRAPVRAPASVPAIAGIDDAARARIIIPMRSEVEHGGRRCNTAARRMGSLDWPSSVPHTLLPAFAPRSGGGLMKLEWQLPEVSEDEVGLEVTSYASAELDRA
jgi:coenzyme PQQ precursor peptide PqqA